MNQKHVLSALFVVLVAVGGFGYTLAVGNEPLLGLDLQGGVSVVYQPTSVADDDALDQTVEIIRARVDALGVAEPEISRQGGTIVVDLPGVEEQQRALQLIGQTAELRFRPLLPFPTPTGEFNIDDLIGNDPLGEEPDASQTEGTPGSDEEGLGPLRRRQGTGDGTDEDPAESQVPPVDSFQLGAETACSGQLTRPEDDFAEAFVLLPMRDGGVACLGPTLLTGETLETSEVSFDTREWGVNPVFKAGDEGIGAFNAVAELCFNATPACPTRQLAIVLDREVISAPSINAPAFERDRIVISGSFTEDEARDLNTALKFGALPVELEAQATRTVSATIGDDILRSGATAGLIGLALVGVYLLAYYRLSGLVAIMGLVLSGLMLWTIIAWFGANQGLAISLAGLVGLTVAIGVSADSNIVYFENVKESISQGRRIPTAIERAYESSISTILKADIVSLIAAGLLYFLTVGAVRGFAFYLGVATLLDLFVSYLFMRPALALIARMAGNNPKLLGLRVEVDS